MAVLPKEHNGLYFDKLVRTQKSESLLSLIMATYHAYNSSAVDVKADIAKRLVDGYNLFRNNPVGQNSGAGTYEGTSDQFASQYTIGHEMAIWKDSDLHLTDFAKKVATNEITIREYLDVIFLNYIQPISGKIVHPLYEILSYMKTNNVKFVEKSNLPSVLKCNCDNEAINGLVNLIKDTNYLYYKDSKLELNDSINLDLLLGLCNKKYLSEDGFLKAKNELSNSSVYEEYISTNQKEIKSLYIFRKAYEYDDLSFDDVVKKLKESINSYDKVVGIHLFGIEYGPCIRKNKYNINDIVRAAGISDSYFVEINKGIKLSKYVYPKDNFDGDTFINNNVSENNCEIDVLNHNLYGIHITNLNDALSETNPHICIGWASMGDLSNYTNKTEMAAKYNETWPDAKPMTKAQNVGQLNRFVNEAKIGDYVLFIDYKKINIGVIESDYIYNNISYAEQDPEYVNVRKVKWIKKDIDRSIFPKAMSNSMASAMSFFKLNDYRSVIADVLNDSYESDETANDDSGLKEIVDYNFTNKSGVNLIVYGTPGCGKSYYVQHTLLYKGGYRFDDNGINCLDAIRTTFFQDYTNTDFVGQIMPVVNADKSVTYEFNPGPFTLALNKAIQNPDKPIALVIEELNRGNAASIFGDIFQLLDRDNGTSIYNITNVNIQKYLEEQNPTMKFDYIKLPSNLSIFATMNTSDQNVFTLDTAFKRRWKFEKIKNTFLENHKFKGSFIPGMDMDWEEFCNSINEYIVNDKNFINSEDKQLGVYFVDEKGLRKVQGDVSTEESRKEFAYKIFEYLWDDVAKYDREKWFNNIKTLDTLIDKYVDEGADDKSGINVFSDGIFKKK